MNDDLYQAVLRIYATKSKMIIEHSILTFLDLLSWSELLEVSSLEENGSATTGAMAAATRMSTMESLV